jgi:hypothetical protein
MTRLLRALSVLALALLGASAGAQPAEPIVLRSEAGRFSLQLSGLARPETLNRLHGFDLTLAAADGGPVAGAAIALSGERRFARNPLPTAPQVRPGAVPGSYRVEGVRFHMAGEWRLVLSIEFEQIRDRAILDLVVK